MSCAPWNSHHACHELCQDIIKFKKKKNKDLKSKIKILDKAANLDDTGCFFDFVKKFLNDNIGNLTEKGMEIDEKWAPLFILWSDPANWNRKLGERLKKSNSFEEGMEYFDEWAEEEKQKKKNKKKKNKKKKKKQTLHTGGCAS